MTLGSDLAAALPLLRAEAESRMTETVIAGTFKDGTDENGDATRVPDAVRYEGRGRIRYGSLAASNDLNQVAQPVVMQSPFLSVPWGSPRLFEGDDVVVPASGSDPLLVGRTYRVAGNAVIGQVTTHRYPLIELS